jgi:hypothetical protein
MMTIPKLLLSRVLNPDEAEPLTCTAIAQLSRNAEHPAEEVFEILVRAYAGDRRQGVEQAIFEGIVVTTSRAVHSDTLVRQTENLRSFRGDRYARLFMCLLFSNQVPSEVRIAAAAALATHNETNLSAGTVLAAENLLQAILNDDREDAEVQRSIRTYFGRPRIARPRIHPVVASRGDETVAL